MRELWNRFFFTGFSAGSLGALRAAFGGALFFFHFTQFDNVFRWDVLGPRYYYIDPMWHFELLGIQYNVPFFSWLVFGLLLLSTTSFTLGLWTRRSALLLILCIFYLKGVRDSVAGDVHHRYLMPIQILFLLTLSRCGWAWSLDNRIRARRGAARQGLEAWEANWPIKAAQLYVVSFYFWGALAKLRVSGLDWISGGERIQHLLLKRTLLWGVTDAGEPLGNPLAYQIAQYPTLCLALAVMTIAFELGFPLLLLVKSQKWRLILISGVVLFHLSNAVLAYVNFLLIPFVFFVFFDLDPIFRRVRQRFRRAGPAASPAPG